MPELKKEKDEFDISVTLTASEENGFFAVVFKAIELLFPDLSDKQRRLCREGGPGAPEFRGERARPEHGTGVLPERPPHRGAAQ